MPRPRREGAREKILDQASALFYARGVAAVSMNDVILAVGCGKSLLYRHFPAKDDLVAAYLARFSAWRQESAMRAIAAADGMPGEQLVALTEEIAARVTEPAYRGCGVRNYLSEIARPSPRPRRVARTYLRENRRRLDRLAFELDPTRAPRLADQIWLVHEGLYATQRSPSPRRVATAAVDLVRAFVAAPVFPVSPGDVK